ncbi:ankyrin repeat domain-containing protein [Lewinella cohaerens]|uniref:ankyrin repeat domain-containing protein n=1 Tax=Lewinella cohaerens TaxID=70995 RepID=UPI0003608F41|nr:ankyrin repeat domain-containing protein [Lewinella cohaerens]
MRNLFYLCALVILATSSVQAQEETSIPDTPASNAEDVLNMPSKWDKLKDDKKIRFLFAAVERGDVELAQTMLPDVSLPYYQHNTEGETLLTLAIEAGQYEMVKWLCEDAVINLKNEDGETPLTLAIKEQNMGIINLVLERAKADLPNDQDETPLMLAVSYGYEPAFLKQLTSLGANPNRLSNGISPLSRAVEKENIANAAMLVRYGADPSIANKDGIIPLYQAVKLDHSVLAGVLLHRSTQPGKDANWQTPIGETLTNMAVTQQNTAMLRVLVEKGANVNTVDYMENTPLHLAAERGMTDAVDILLANGAFVDPINIMGVTPIMAAAQRGHDDLASHLAQAGANPNLRDYSGIAANDFGTYEYTDPYLQQEVDFLLQESNE